MSTEYGLRNTIRYIDSFSLKPRTFNEVLKVERPD